VYVDIAGQVAELDRQPPGEADQQPHGYQRDAERDEQAAEGHDLSIGAGHMKKKNIGSSFDSWLREERIYEEVTATAIKRVLARQVEAAMQEKQFQGGDGAEEAHQPT
jgi:hypothetical protein